MIDSHYIKYYCANGAYFFNPNGSHYGFEEGVKDDESGICLNVKYDPDAECPAWDRTLRDVFYECEDPEAVTKYLEEIIGYAIQSRKVLASWWLFVGGSAAGISLVNDVLRNICGKHYLNTPLTYSKSDGRTPGSAEFYAANYDFSNLQGALVASEDIYNANSVYLPAPFLKHISKNTFLTVSKGENEAKSGTFMSTVTPIVSSEGFPSLDFHTSGNKICAHVLQFPSKLDLICQSVHDEIINNELSGVLNRAISGAKRMMARGTFSPPTECQEITNRFRNKSFTFLNFITEKIVRTKQVHRYMVKSHMYDMYLKWCYKNNATDNVLSKIDFYVNCKDIGIEERRNPMGKSCFWKVIDADGGGFLDE